MKKLLIIIPIMLNTSFIFSQFLRNDTVIETDTFIQSILMVNPIKKIIQNYYITIDNDTIEVDKIKYNKHSSWLTGGLCLNSIRCYKSNVKTFFKPLEVKGFKKNNEIYISGREKDEKKITFFKIVQKKDWINYERDYLVPLSSSSSISGSEIATIIYYRVPNTDPPIFEFKGSK